MKTYHQRVFILDYAQEDLPMFKTDAEMNEFYRVLGRTLAYGMYGDRDEDCLDLVTSTLTVNPLEVDAAYWPRLPCVDKYEDGSRKYLGSAEGAVRELQENLRRRMNGRAPFVIGAVLHGDGAWGFHS